MGIFAVILIIVMVLCGLGAASCHETGEKERMWNAICIGGIAFGLWLGVMF